MFTKPICEWTVRKESYRSNKGTYSAINYFLFDKSILSVSIQSCLQLTVDMAVPIRERRGDRQSWHLQLFSNINLIDKLYRPGYNNIKAIN